MDKQNETRNYSDGTPCREFAIEHCGKADSILGEQFVGTEHDLIYEIELGNIQSELGTIRVAIESSGSVVENECSVTADVKKVVQELQIETAGVRLQLCFADERLHTVIDEQYRIQGESSREIHMFLTSWMRLAMRMLRTGETA